MGTRPVSVEQVVDGTDYTIELAVDGWMRKLTPDEANALAYALTEAALEPDRCLDCGNYAAPTAEHCPAHLADADDLPDYADWRQA